MKTKQDVITSDIAPDLLFRQILHFNICTLVCEPKCVFSGVDSVDCFYLKNNGSWTRGGPLPSNLFDFKTGNQGHRDVLSATLRCAPMHPYMFIHYIGLTLQPKLSLPITALTEFQSVQSYQGFFFNCHCIHFWFIYYCHLPWYTSVLTEYITETKLQEGYIMNQTLLDFHSRVNFI